MLVLSRKIGESIVINESIRVTVLQAANGRIRLGIEAPPEVIVLREELTKSCFNSSPSKNGKPENPAEYAYGAESTASFRPAALSNQVQPDFPM